MKIILICAVGMSTSLLTKKMREAAQAEGIELDVSAISQEEVQEVIHDVDIILLGPQIAYKKDTIQKIHPSIPVEAIPMLDYGTMNGKKILSDTIKFLKDQSSKGA